MQFSPCLGPSSPAQAAKVEHGWIWLVFGVTESPIKPFRDKPLFHETYQGTLDEFLHVPPKWTIDCRTLCFIWKVASSSG